MKVGLRMDGEKIMTAFIGYWGWPCLKLVKEEEVQHNIIMEEKDESL